MTTSKPLPMRGVRVLDFSRLLPGPWATQMLAEFGAEVIKVEQPGTGDPSRHNRPQLTKHSYYFNAMNAFKRSITLDLSKPAGRAIAHRLVADSDVAVESSRAGGAAKLGLDYKTLQAINPRLIYCSITGFGQTGPLSPIAGHDLVIQGLTGLMGTALDRWNPPSPPGFHAANFAAALYAIIGIQAALAQREKTGEGCDIDLGMFDALFNMCIIPLSSAMARMVGHSGLPKIESFGANPRYDTYVSKDGKPLAVSLLETRSWRAFCVSVGREDLIPENESLADRLSAHGPQQAKYREALAEFCAKHDWGEIMRHLEATGIAICPICTPEEAVALPHVASRGLINTINHPVEGVVPHLVNPLARAGLAQIEHDPAPDLGEHTDAILDEFGFTSAQIAEFRRDGIV
jgi:alpha-methylacyl-CoA racemase